MNLTPEQEALLFQLGKHPKNVLLAQIRARELLLKTEKYWLEVFRTCKTHPEYLDKKIKKCEDEVSRLKTQIKIRQIIAEDK